MAAETPDAGLMRRIAEGDSRSLAVLYRRYGRMVYGLALRMVGDRGTAEEITQDVFTNVWRSAGNFRPEASAISTWIMRIARNRSIDELRRRQVRPTAQDLDWDRSIEPRSHPGDDPALAAEAAIRAEQVREAAISLPPEQWQALAMAFFKGLSHREIAATLGEPLGTVKTRIRLAMDKLRAELDEGRQSS